MTFVHRVVGAVVGVIVLAVGAGFLLGALMWFIDHPATVGGWLGDLLDAGAAAATAVATFVASIANHLKSM